MRPMQVNSVYEKGFLFLLPSYQEKAEIIGKILQDFSWIFFLDCKNFILRNQGALRTVQYVCGWVGKILQRANWSWKKVKS
jgi:hypothetical protein